MKKNKNNRNKLPKPKRKSKNKSIRASSSITLKKEKWLERDQTSPLALREEAPFEVDKGLILAAEMLANKNPHDAFEICRKVLTAEPHNSIALNLAGVAAFQVGLIEDALNLLQTSIFQSPNYAEAHTNLGNVLASLGKFEEAEVAYKQSMRADPNYIEAQFNYGLLMEKKGNYLEAIDVLEKVVNLQSNHSRAWYALGNAYKIGRRILAAQEAYQNSIEREPHFPDAHINLAAVFQELGQFKVSADHARKALSISPHLPEAQYNLAIALQELGQFKESNRIYKKLLEVQPKHAAAAMNLALGHQKLGELEQSEIAFKQAIGIDPNYAKAHVNFADLLLQIGQSKRALQICEEYLKQHPGNSELTAFKTIVLHELGDHLKAEKILSIKNFLKTEKIKKPDNYRNISDFNSALVSHLRGHPTLTEAPQSHATRNGQHSGELLESPKGPFGVLEGLLISYMIKYKEELGAETEHPFMLAAPRKMKLSVWGVIMRQEGHQLPHIHPSAWLSGVYYLEVPETCTPKKESNKGWLAFGQPPEHFHTKFRSPACFVEPKPGLLVLFPSYYYHHTVPFDSAESRVSIAFDFIPE